MVLARAHRPFGVEAARGPIIALARNAAPAGSDGAYPTESRQKHDAVTGTSVRARARSSRCFTIAASAARPSRSRHSWYPCRLHTLSGCWEARLRVAS